MSERLTDSPELLRLGIDMDGVVADFNAGWIERYNRDFGAALHPDHVVGWDELHRLTGVGSSRVDLQACKLEYSIVSPK